MATIQEMALLILAGGKSSRMGTNKALLELGETTLIEKIIDKGKDFGFQEIIIVTNEIDKYTFSDVKVVKDYYPGYGPLAGIQAGLIHSGFNENFVIPCDMPFLSLDIINKLISRQQDCQVVVPTMGGKFQPLSAIYTKDCIAHIEYLLKRNLTKVIMLYDLVKTCYVEIVEDKSFFNVNTPEDYQKAQRYFKEEFEYGKNKG